MLTPLVNLLEALGQRSTVDAGAVGLGSVNVPGMAAVVPYLLQYAQQGSYGTPLGPFHVGEVTVRGDQLQAVLTAGSLCGTVTYPIPERLRGLARGEWQNCGQIEVRGELAMPEIVWKGDHALLTLSSPLSIRNFVTEGRLRQRIAQFLSTELHALRIYPTHGEPVVGRLASWIAPRLNWT